jgi:hypothetical protein
MKKPASLFIIFAILLSSLAISVNALAVDSTLLHYKPHDPKLKYGLTMTSRSRPEAVFELGPLEETEDFLTISQRVGSESDGLLDIALTVDEINWNQHGPSRGSSYKREEIIGNTGYLRVNVLGKVAEARGIPHFSSIYFHRDNLSGPPLDIYRTLTMLYPQFPMRLLKKGDQWKLKDDIFIESAKALPIRGIATLKYELEMTVKRNIKYSLIDYTERKGHRAVRVGFEATFSTEGAIATEAVEHYTEGDGTCSGDLYFSLDDGILLEVKMKSELNESRSTGGRVRHWFNPETSINILLGGQKSTPITWLTKQEVHFELLGEKQ